MGDSGQPLTRSRLRSGFVIAGYAAASLLGLKLGWDFGNQVAGPWLGTITALNGVLFCALLMSLAERALAWVAAKAKPRPGRDRG